MMLYNIQDGGEWYADFGLIQNFLERHRRDRIYRMKIILKGGAEISEAKFETLTALR